MATATMTITATTLRSGVLFWDDEGMLRKVDHIEPVENCRGFLRVLAPVIDGCSDSVKTDHAVQKSLLLVAIGDQLRVPA